MAATGSRSLIAPAASDPVKPSVRRACAGIDKHGEPGRGRYLDDAEFDAIYAAGDELLRDAMDLLSSTSQRPGDVVKMKRTSIRDGALWGRQGKTGTPQRFELEGDLKEVIERTTTRGREADSVYLIADVKGQPLTYWQLEDRWSCARAKAAETLASVSDAQMRDIRGKTATDVEDLAHAQALLGHKSRTMTEPYVKQRAGGKVKPHTRRKRAQYEPALATGIVEAPVVCRKTACASDPRKPLFYW